jgi:hypothetical protein
VSKPPKSPQRVPDPNHPRPSDLAGAHRDDIGPIPTAPPSHQAREAQRPERRPQGKAPKPSDHAKASRADRPGRRGR